MKIELKNLNFNYGQTKVLQDISFCLNNKNKGQIIGIVGPNGTGKTTLMKCMAGFFKQTRDNVLFNDNIMTEKQINKIVHYLPQSLHINAHLSAFEILILAYKKDSGYRVNKDDLDAVSKIFATMEIEYLAHKNINEMSGGQKQLVFLAQSLLRKKDILLLDEPTSALDIYHQIKMMQIISAWAKQQKSTVFVALHDLPLVARFCQQVIVLNNGNLEVVGKTATVFNKKFFKDIYKMDCYIGKTSKNNLIIQPENIIK